MPISIMDASNSTCPIENSGPGTLISDHQMAKGVQTLHSIVYLWEKTIVMKGPGKTCKPFKHNIHTIIMNIHVVIQVKLTRVAKLITCSIKSMLMHKVTLRDHYALDHVKETMNLNTRKQRDKKCSIKNVNGAFTRRNLGYQMWRQFFPLFRKKIINVPEKIFGRKNDLMWTDGDLFLQKVKSWSAKRNRGERKKGKNFASNKSIFLTDNDHIKACFFFAQAAKRVPLRGRTQIWEALFPFLPGVKLVV